jgi:esterase
VLRDRRGRHAPPSLQETFAKIRAGLPSLSERLPSITCPALVVRGAESDVPSEADAERFADALKNGHSVTIPNAGHNVHGDNSRGLAHALKQFLAAAA